MTSGFEERPGTGDEVLVQRSFISALFTTWTGRILLINALVFLVMSVESGSIFYPGNDSILTWGAKEPVAIVKGQYWRFVTPLFIHIGIIHFLFNSYILYIVGNQLETILGPRRFLLIFLASGILGNVASAVLSPVVSAGASSSIFGLLGCGFYIERTVRRHLERDAGLRSGSRAYAITVLINLVFGFVVPFIDNAAHVGGLIGGFLLTVALIHLNPTPAISRVVKIRRSFGSVMLGAFLALTIGGAVLASNREYVTFLLEFAAKSKDQPAEQAFFYSRILALNPQDNDARINRALIYIENGESRAGYDDIRTAVANGCDKSRLLEVADELQGRGLVTEAWQVRMIAGHTER
jgi:membrane associated rhomboid family serine protease